MFWGITRFTNQSLGSLSQDETDYTFRENLLLEHSSDFYIKRTRFPSSQNFFVVIVIFYLLLATKEK